jgi:nitrogen-specific signal transduction histidine kinase
LEKAVSALREADHSKDEFLNMLSHELRNPLAPIRTAICLLSRVDPHAASGERARLVIQRQTRHARSERGRGPIRDPR